MRIPNPKYDGVARVPKTINVTLAQAVENYIDAHHSNCGMVITEASCLLHSVSAEFEKRLNDD